jgi:hypothetical protein
MAESPDAAPHRISVRIKTGRIEKGRIECDAP